MTLDTLLADTATLHVVGDPAPWTAFERAYGAIREGEGRLLEDAVVRTLPEVPPGHPHYEEWRIRAGSLRRLTVYLEQRPGLCRILDLGCGNGWMSRHLAGIPGVQVVGMDIHRVELEQAVRLFGGRPNLAFLAADLFDRQLDGLSFDAVVAASCIQYFPDLSDLVARLSSLLRPGGELHILDSPLYSRAEKSQAAGRSADYFAGQGHPEMSAFYHHHSLSDLSHLPFRLLHDPGRPLTRLRRRLGRFPHSPFPWVMISQTGGQAA